MGGVCHIVMLYAYYSPPHRKHLHSCCDREFLHAVLGLLDHDAAEAVFEDRDYQRLQREEYHHAHLVQNNG